jgi:hypothetical protein
MIFKLKLAGLLALHNLKSLPVIETVAKNLRISQRPFFRDWGVLLQLRG